MLAVILVAVVVNFEYIHPNALGDLRNQVTQCHLQQCFLLGGIIFFLVFIILFSIIFD